MKRVKEFMAGDGTKKVKIKLTYDRPMSWRNDADKEFEQIISDIFLALEKHFFVSKIRIQK